MAKALVWEPDYLERKVSNAMQAPNAVVISPEAQESLYELYESDLEAAGRDAAKSLAQDGPISQLENFKDRLEQKVEALARAWRMISNFFFKLMQPDTHSLLYSSCRTEGKYRYFGCFMFRNQEQQTAINLVWRQVESM